MHQGQGHFSKKLIFFIYFRPLNIYFWTSKYFERCFEKLFELNILITQELNVQKAKFLKLHDYT